MTSITVDEVDALSRASAIDLSLFRPAHIEARVQRALQRSSSPDVSALEALIGADAKARADFRQSVAISVTGFFRDAEQFDLLEAHLSFLRQKAFPRVWSAGCSTGRELWSLAVLLGRIGAADRAYLLGSDLLEENVRAARAGIGTEELGGQVLPTAARLSFEVRDIVAEGPPGGGWDVIVCRNVAIYLAPPARTRLHEQLAGALTAGGLLLLGRSERLSDARSLGLELVAPHLYRKTVR